MEKTTEKEAGAAFEQLQNFKADLERQAALLRGRERELTSELARLEASLDERIIEGSHQEAQDTINKLVAELAAVRRELQTLESPPPGGILGKLRTDALNEIRDTLAERRKFWQGDLRPRLEAKKAEFVALVKEAGLLYQEGQGLVWKFTSVAGEVPGPTQGAPEFMTNIISRADRHTGPIYLDHLETEKTFTGGK